MNKLFSFLMVGAAFTALQVATAEANEMECVNAGTPNQVADCWKAKAQSGSMKHGQNQHDATQGSTAQGFAGEQHHDGSKGQQHHDGAQGQQHHDDMKAQQHYDDMGNKGQQHHEGTQGNAAQGFSGEHQDKGGHHDGPPIDPRSGQPFTQADEAKFQRFADECEATRGLLSEGSTQELVKEGFTRIQVEKLCKDGPEQGSGGGQGGHNAPPARR